MVTSLLHLASKMRYRDVFFLHFCQYSETNLKETSELEFFLPPVTKYLLRVQHELSWDFLSLILETLPYNNQCTENKQVF